MKFNQPASNGTGRVLVTGANGFIGQALCDQLHRQRRLVRAAMRSATTQVKSFETVGIDAIDAATDWSDSLHDVDVVIHLAARVHLMKDDATDQLAAFRQVNVDGTLNLARQAVEASVRRFVYISSIKVNGENTLLEKPFTADDSPAPGDYYAISKREAEDGLRQIAVESGLEVVIIRPPLIHGPGVKANFRNMLYWLEKGIPLPFGAIYNKRSLVALDNIINLIVTCIDHPNAANQTFLVSDGDDMSTTELLKRLAVALDKPARLLPVPVYLLQMIAALLVRRELYRRLCESLQVDISKTRDLLGWTPPMSSDEALRKTAEDFLNTRRNNSRF